MRPYYFKKGTYYKNVGAGFSQETMLIENFHDLSLKNVHLCSSIVQLLSLKLLLNLLFNSIHLLPYLIAVSFILIF